MKITILCVGKIKEKFYRDALAEYEKRLSRYCNLEIIEVLDEKTPDKASDVLKEQILKKEADKILLRLKEDSYVITLEINGVGMDSISFSNLVQKGSVEGKGNIVFIVGGSLGLHESVSKIANYKLSFSEMTFPHQLMRVILCEQIYRAYRIINGEPYHK